MASLYRIARAFEGKETQEVRPIIEAKQSIPANLPAERERARQFTNKLLGGSKEVWGATSSASEPFIFNLTSSSLALFLALFSIPLLAFR